MAPNPTELRNRLRADFPLIPPNVLDIIVEVHLQDPAFVKELARDAQTKERRGRGNARAGRPPKPPVEQKTIKIQPFEEFMRENPGIFASAYDPDGKPKATLMIEEGSVPSAQVEEMSCAPSIKDDALAAVE